MHPDLVLLRDAVRLVYAAVFYRRADSAVSQERLAGIAHAMAALVPIYVRESHYVRESDMTVLAAPRRLTPAELAGAMVRRGGAELHFSDGRPALRDPQVTRTGIEHVIRLLGGESASDPEPDSESELRTELGL
jgi:hypothetical protein